MLVTFATYGYNFDLSEMRGRNQTLSAVILSEASYEQLQALMKASSAQDFMSSPYEGTPAVFAVFGTAYWSRVGSYMLLGIPKYFRLCRMVDSDFQSLVAIYFYCDISEIFLLNIRVIVFGENKSREING
jgi:hypothetical protein